MPGTTAVFLGFDASCSYCSSMAESLAREVGDLVTVLPLADERMRRWRNQVWGDDAPWAPTLVRVSDEQPKAWTGWKIAPVLTKEVGPQKALTVLSTLGAEELNRTASPDRSSKIITRRASLRAGLAVTAGALLVGGGGVLGRPRPAAAAGPKTVTSEANLWGTEADGVLTDMWDSADVQNVVAEADESTLVPAGAFSSLKTTAMSGGAAGRTIGTVETTVLRTELDGGIERVLAVEYDETNERLLCYATFSEPVDGVGSAAYAIRFSGWDEEHAQPKNFQVLSNSFNGAIPTAPAEGDTAVALANGEDPCGGCNGVCQIGGDELRGECKTESVVQCVLGTVGCALCATCSGVGVCIACFAVSCSSALLSCCGSTHNERCRRCRRVC